MSFKAWSRKTFSFQLETKYSSGKKTVDKMELCKSLTHCMCTAREEIISISNFSDSTIKRLQNTWMKSFARI